MLIRELFALAEAKAPKFKKGDKVKCYIEPVQGTPNSEGPQKEWLDGTIVKLADVKHHNRIWMVKFNAEDAQIICDTYAIDDEDGDHTFGWTEDDIKKATVKESGDKAVKESHGSEYQDGIWYTGKKLNDGLNNTISRILKSHGLEFDGYNRQYIWLAPKNQLPRKR